MTIEKLFNTLFIPAEKPKTDTIICPVCSNNAIAWGYDLRIVTPNLTVCRHEGAEYVHYENK